MNYSARVYFVCYLTSRTQKSVHQTTTITMSNIDDMKLLSPHNICFRIGFYSKFKIQIQTINRISKSEENPKCDRMKVLSWHRNDQITYVVIFSYLLCNLQQIYIERNAIRLFRWKQTQCYRSYANFRCANRSICTLTYQVFSFLLVNLNHTQRFIWVLLLFVLARGGVYTKCE